MHEEYRFKKLNILLQEANIVLVIKHLFSG
jgi:hypothetical protein